MNVKEREGMLDVGGWELKTEPRLSAFVLGRSATASLISGGEWGVTEPGIA